MVRCSRGFTLVEMMIVVLLMGLMLAFAVPALRRLGNTQNLKGARENIIAQVQMARAKAITTGVDQPIHFYPGTYGFDYHIHPVGVGVATVGWNFPRGVSYGWSGGTLAAVTMQKDGTASNSVTIPLVNAQGVRDTVAVMVSGMVVSQ